MTTDTDKASDKLVEMALKAAFEKGWCAAAQWAQRDDLRHDTGSIAYAGQRDAILAGKAAEVRAAIIADLCGDVEPVALMFQHSETGRIAFVDAWQKENGWATANPRYKEVGALHGASTVAALKARVAELEKDAELLDWLEEKHYALHPIKEAAGDDQYTLWWQVTDKRKSISGHPLGNIRAAIRAARAAERKAHDRPNQAGRRAGKYCAYGISKRSS